MVVVAAAAFAVTVALTELGALGVVPRYCAVRVREPVVVGTQAREALYLVVHTPPINTCVACTAVSPSAVLPSRKRTVPKLVAEQPCVASHGKLPPAAGATSTVSD